MRRRRLITGQVVPLGPRESSLLLLRFSAHSSPVLILARNFNLVFWLKFSALLCTMKQKEAKANLALRKCQAVGVFSCVLPMIERFTCFTLYCFFHGQLWNWPKNLPFFFSQNILFLSFSLLSSLLLFSSRQVCLLILSRFLSRWITPNLVVVSFLSAKNKEINKQN